MESSALVAAVGGASTVPSSSLFSCELGRPLKGLGSFSGGTDRHGARGYGVGGKLRQQSFVGLSICREKERVGKKGELIGLPAQCLKLVRSNDHSIGAESKTRGRKGGVSGHSRRLNSASSDTFSSPKTGTLGEDRFKDGAVPGTYWNDSLDLGEEATVCFNTGSKTVTVACRAGENLLRVAERCGVFVPNAEFCFEGSCCHCEMEIQGGAAEVGYRADLSGADLIRSCICPIPKRRTIIEVNVLSEEDVWGEGVL